jgi:hypothetical protein
MPTIHAYFHEHFEKKKHLKVKYCEVIKKVSYLHGKNENYNPRFGLNNADEIT